MLFWLSCFAAGLSLCLTVWVFTRPAVAGRSPADMPEGGVLLRLAWPWIQAGAAVCEPFVSWRMRLSLRPRIRTAGLFPYCKPEHIVAMQMLAFALSALATGLLSLQAGLDPSRGMLLGVVIGLASMLLPRRWLSDLGRRRQGQMLRELPFLLDMATLCVEAGLNLQGALQQAAQHGPEGPLRAELQHALADMRAGLPRMQALEELAERTGLAAVRSLVTALVQADQLGMSLGPLLRSQSVQRRTERFLRAEKQALEAPVKMLFPMVFCIFPCTFLIIGFPIVVKLLSVDY
ncbi:MAG TPA: type II secretion system F family protein [Burkholderiaceae bacterium]|nr:type II secretion system F family protein [Burkholderiaceae bacterium]